MKKLIIAAALTACSFASSATPFFIDLDGAGTTPSAELDRLIVSYNSYSSIDFLTGDVETKAGIDLIDYTFGGLLGAPIFSDFDAGFVSTQNVKSSPNESFDELGPFGSGFALSFGLTLSGDFDGTTISYTGGTIDLYKYETAAMSLAPAAVDNYVKIIESDFTSEQIFGGNQTVTSIISESADVLAPGKDSFFFEDYKGDLVSFEDYVADIAQFIRMTIVQVTKTQEIPGAIANPVAGSVAGGAVVITTDHEANVRFEVPEPASLAVLGLGLLGLGAAGRRRRTA